MRCVLNWNPTQPPVLIVFVISAFDLLWASGLVSARNPASLSLSFNCLAKGTPLSERLAKGTPLSVGIIHCLAIGTPLSSGVYCLAKGTPLLVQLAKGTPLSDQVIIAAARNSLANICSINGDRVHSSGLGIGSYYPG